VRDLEELLNDPHMHGRGMLEVVDHYDYGPVVLPNSPLRFHGTDTVPTRVSPRVGEHNDDVYGGCWVCPPTITAAARRGSDLTWKMPRKPRRTAACC